MVGGENFRKTKVTNKRPASTSRKLFNLFGLKVTNLYIFKHIFYLVFELKLNDIIVVLLKRNSILKSISNPLNLYTSFT